jgi:hypothetical protein
MQLKAARGRLIDEIRPNIPASGALGVIKIAQGLFVIFNQFGIGIGIEFHVKLSAGSGIAPL